MAFFLEVSTTFFCSTKGSKLGGRQILKSQRTGKPKTLTICRSVVTCNFWSMDSSDLPLFGARHSWAWHHFLYLSIPFEKYYQIIKRPKKTPKNSFLTDISIFSSSWRLEVIFPIFSLKNCVVSKKSS